MGEVRALRAVAGRPGTGSAANHGEIGFARRPATLDQALGDFDHYGMHENLLICSFYKQSGGIITTSGTISKKYVCLNNKITPRSTT